MATIAEALRIAIGHQQAGRLAEAEQIFHQVLAAAPEHPDALHQLGIAALRGSRLDEAAQWIERAIAAHPAPAFYSNLGLVYREQHRFAAALAAFQKAIELQPNYAQGFNNLGLCQQNLEQFDEARASYERAIVLRPEMVEAHVNLGILLQQRGHRDESLACYRRAIALQPSYALAHGNLGTLLRELGQRDEARAAYETALKLDPNYVATYNNLGTLLKEMRRPGEARAAYERAIGLKPQHAKYHYNLGNFFRDMFERGEAERCYRHAIALDPQLADAHVNLGNVLQDQGLLTDGRMQFDRALAIDPTHALAFNNRLMNESYRADTTPAAMQTLLDDWQLRFEQPLLATWRPHDKARDPEKLLNVGFVSADFGVHPIGTLMTHVVERLDRGQFLVHCYSHRTAIDHVSERLQRGTDTWRQIVELSDVELAEQIRTDGIDILIDLSGHTAGNRLGVFARKPAPVQATWLGFAGSTGLRSIDWLLADRWLVPIECDGLYRERVWRLPLSNACFDMPGDAPEVAPPPCVTRKQVTLGCFNNPIKITDLTLAAWSKILNRVTVSRLLLKYQGLHDPATQASMARRMQAAGIDLTRVEFEGMTPLSAMLARYNDVDVALDPFPYTGGTSSMLALWMGVPVVTLPGQTLASRQTLSILANAGVMETVARDTDHYVDLAVELVHNHARLATLRNELRPKLASSSYCDPNQFVPTLAAALRAMWRAYVQSCT